MNTYTSIKAVLMGLTMMSYCLINSSAYAEEQCSPWSPEDKAVVVVKVFDQDSTYFVGNQGKKRRVYSDYESPNANSILLLLKSAKDNYALYSPNRDAFITFNPKRKTLHADGDISEATRFTFVKSKDNTYKIKSALQNIYILREKERGVLKLSTSKRKAQSFCFVKAKTQE